MEPLITLYDCETPDPATLPPALATSYGGGLTFPIRETSTRPYVIANFVETLDGIISYNAPGQMDSRLISGDNEQDRMVMGLLRAVADAVIFGSNSLWQDAYHLHIPSLVAPAFAAEYDALRTLMGKTERLPISVILTRSGQVNLSHRTFHTPGLRVLIATTRQGSAYLAQQALPTSTRVVTIEADQSDGTEVSPERVLQLLARDYGVRVALYEGGPTLLSSFLEQKALDELFLTLAPQVAGHTAELHRLSLLEGHAFLPAHALWTKLLSVKLAGSHLLLRYQLT